MCLISIIHSSADDATNILSSIDFKDIQSVKFFGEVSPVPGHHVTITDRVEIEVLYELAKSLYDEQMFITMCGNLTTAKFLSSNGKILATLVINADGSTVVLHNSEDDPLDSIVSSNRALSLLAFQILRLHSPEVLHKARDTGGLCGKSFPFNELEQKANNGR